MIHCKGNLNLLKAEKAVAIIGARSADKEGNTKAYQLAVDYAKAGNVIVSGLAPGCDASAHQGCLGGCCLGKSCQFFPTNETESVS